jgi:hypothetical protein
MVNRITSTTPSIPLLHCELHKACITGAAAAAAAAALTVTATHANIKRHLQAQIIVQPRLLPAPRKQVLSDALSRHYTHVRACGNSIRVQHLQPCPRGVQSCLRLFVCFFVGPVTHLWSFIPSDTLRFRSTQFDLVRSFFFPRSFRALPTSQIGCSCSNLHCLRVALRLSPSFALYAATPMLQQRARFKSANCRHPSRRRIYN